MCESNTISGAVKCNERDQDKASEHASLENNNKSSQNVSRSYCLSPHDVRERVGRSNQWGGQLGGISSTLKTKEKNQHNSKSIQIATLGT